MCAYIYRRGREEEELLGERQRRQDSQVVEQKRIRVVEGVCARAHVCCVFWVNGLVDVPNSLHTHVPVSTACSGSCEAHTKIVVREGPFSAGSSSCVS